MIGIEWKEIPYYSNYEVSNDGRIRNKKTGRERKTRLSHSGKKYPIINFYDKSSGKSKTLSVHRAVLSAFAPVEGWEHLQVNHKDENKQNNNIDNLEWCNNRYNSNYGNRPLSNGYGIRCVETNQYFDTISDAIRAGELTANIYQNTKKGYYYDRKKDKTWSIFYNGYGKEVIE